MHPRSVGRLVIVIVVRVVNIDRIAVGFLACWLGSERGAKNGSEGKGGQESFHRNDSALNDFFASYPALFGKRDDSCTLLI